MLMIATKTSLVVLAGVYAMRASNVLFHPVPVTPLMGVALFAFVMSLILFHNPPTSRGWWLYTVIGLWVVGVAANTMLLLAPDAAHGTPTNRAFSAVSIAGWAIVAIGFAATIFERGSDMA
jgi:uncharacterized membrane protein